MDLLASRLSDGRRAAAIPMVRVMMVAVVLQGLAGVLTAVLYARRRVTLPALAVAVYNLRHYRDGAALAPGDRGLCAGAWVVIGAAAPGPATT